MRLGDLDHLLLKLDAEFSDDARYIDIADQIRVIIDNAPTVNDCPNCEYKLQFDYISSSSSYKELQALRKFKTEHERPQGEWIFMQGVTCGSYYKCNKCGEVERAEKNYCSNCGADMRGGAE